MLVSRRVAIGLVLTAILLPMLLTALLATGRLLGALGDGEAARWLDGLALFAGLVWGFDLICLVLWLAVERLGEGEPPPDELE